jgi:uncharacterized membrane protein YsdA (DUF1294 family)
MNIAGFLTMGIDKRRAVKNRWRIPERTLFLVALLGGGIGSYLGMHSFRHKTKHMSFRIVLPVSAAVTLFFIYYFIINL